MSSGCDHKNLLVRDGTSQQQRMPPALDPTTAKLDDRSALDIIDQARQIAKLVQYYNAANKADGNWEDFFASDVGALLAIIHKMQPEDVVKSYDYLAEEIRENANANDAKKLFKTLFDLAFTLVDQLDKWYQKVLSMEELKVNKELYRLIRSGLDDQLEYLLALYKETDASPKLINSSHFDPASIPFPIKNSNELLSRGFDEVWYVDGTTSSMAWADYYDAIAPATDSYGPDRSNSLAAIRYAVGKVGGVVGKLYGALSQLVNGSESLLDDALENYPYHEPHMGLFLAFVQLLAHSQEHLNTITARHLDYYYKEVLGMDKRPAIPDRAHVIFEPAKHISSELVKGGTELKGGKDNTGVERIYQTADELVVNKASIASLKNLHIERDNNYLIYASPIANSADGVGAKFEGTAKWAPFGEGQQNLDSEERTMPNADVGFAIASNTLRMAEGRRVVHLQMVMASTITAAQKNAIKQALKFELTGEKEWMSFVPTYTTSQPNLDSVSANRIYISGNTLNVYLVMTEEDGPVVPYNSEIHLGNFNTTYPMLRATMREGVNGYPYEAWRSLQLNTVKLWVQADKVKNLKLQSDNANLDPSKPFNPFGPRPATKASFLIGSEEAFSKDLSMLRLVGEWTELPDAGLYMQYKNYTNDLNTDSGINFASFKADVHQLVNGEWKNTGSLTDEVTLFNNQVTGTETQQNAFNKLLFNGSENNVLSNAEIEGSLGIYGINTRSGYIRLQMKSPSMGFGHAAYPGFLLHRTLAQGTSVDATKLPKNPYTPTFKDFYLKYKALGKLNMSSGSESAYEGNGGQFFHILPFGWQERHPYLSGDGSSVSLFPQFCFVDEADGVDTENNGALYIGLAGLVAPQNISMLLQMAEGSEDPELEKQEVRWSYLSSNQWIAFEDSEILEDSTNGLLQSGIVSLAIPNDIDQQNTILPADYHWLRATVSDRTAAICDVLDIRSQAAVAIFIDKKNDSEHLANPLPAESIAKLVIRNADIKSVTQPYASFGGRMQENDSDYYRRVSERLRHKDRAITIWDHERIVLEQFPEVYKVKCINHSTYGLDEKLGKVHNSEFAPGYTTLIAVPKLYNQHYINPYEPKLSKAKLEEIKEFLTERMTPWAADCLKVMNPLYEQIQVEFEVALYDGYDVGYYLKQLNEDIKRFLTPWAYEEGQDISFGGRLHRSSILNFVEECEYVDYIKEFKMNHYVPDQPVKENIETAEPSSARSVFVTYIDEENGQGHIIHELETAEA